MSDICGLKCAIDLKSRLLRALATSDVWEWPDHLAAFMGGLESSRLDDTTALLVLLTDLCAQVRALAEWLCGSECASASTDEPLDWDSSSKRELLASFHRQMIVIIGSMPRVRLSPPIEHVRRFIEDHYAEPVTLDRLALAAGRSKRYLVASFRQQTGVTIHAYLTTVRVRRAMVLMRQGEKAEAVSLLVGYRSKKNFYRHFKAAVGLTPVSYKTAVLKLAR